MSDTLAGYDQWRGEKADTEALRAEWRRIGTKMQELDRIIRAAVPKFYQGPVVSNDHVSRVDYRTPLDDLAEREEAAERDAAFAAIEILLAEGAELPLLFQEKVQEVARAAAMDQFRQYEESFMEWLFAAGPHPLEVVRRLFGYVKMKRPSLLWNMGFREIGPLLRETHAAAALRCKLLFGDTPAGWKKAAEARLKMKASAMGNCNRAALNGEIAANGSVVLRKKANGHRAH